MDLTPNASFFYQIVTFLVLWVCLKRLLFDPTLAVLDARRHRTEGAKAEAEQIMAATHAAQDDYDSRLREARAQIARESEAARKAAQDAYSQAIATARAAATDEQIRLRTALTAQVEEARRTLTAEAPTLAFEMLDRAMGRPSA